MDGPVRTTAVVPLRRILGEPRDAAWRQVIQRIWDWRGWIAATAVIGAGLIVLWQLLFGGSASGSLWMSRPLPLPPTSTAPAQTAPSVAVIAPSLAPTVPPTDPAPTSSGTVPTDDSSGPVATPEPEHTYEHDYGSDDSTTEPEHTYEHDYDHDDESGDSSGSGSSGSDDSSGSGSSGSDDDSSGHGSGHDG